jgi:phosphoribosylaminoimidazole-succinocarboxamide synthase
MTLLHQGKTKDVHSHADHTLRLVFTDRVTKNQQGQIDPGGNTVAETTEPGQGLACLSMTTTIFGHLAQNDIPTHMVSYDLSNLSMIVRKAEIFAPGLEWVCRWVGTGSFIRRYGNVPGARDGMRFSRPVMEITIKDDAGQDPLIVPGAITALGIASEKQLDALISLNDRAMTLIHSLFKAQGLDLWDIKIEWGKDAETGALMLIDEVSANGCRAFDAATGERVAGAALSARFA